MLESRCVTITTQDRSAMGIIPQRNHGAYHSFWIPPRDDQTRVRSTDVLFGQGQRRCDNWDPERSVLDHFGRQATAKIGQVVEQAEASQRTADAGQRRLARQEPPPGQDALSFGLLQRLRRFLLRGITDDLEADWGVGKCRECAPNRDHELAAARFGDGSQIDDPVATGWHCVSRHRNGIGYDGMASPKALLIGELSEQQVE